MIDEPLSPQGQQRRQQILSLAKNEANRRRTRRYLGRGVLFVPAIALMGLGIWTLTQQPPIPKPRPLSMVQIPSPVSTPPPPTVAVEYLQTDPTLTARLSIPPQPPRWTKIDDTDLLQELADAGRPTGIICMNGKTILLPRASSH